MNRVRRFLKMGGIALACAAASALGILLSTWLKLPLWLDTVGICLAAYYTTLPFTLLSVLVSYGFLSIFLDSVLIYLPIDLLLSLAVYSAVHAGNMKSIRSAITSSFVVGIWTVILCTPIDLYLLDGVTHNIWGEALADMLHYYKVPHVLCVIAAEAMVNIIDKQFSACLAYLIIRYQKKKSQKKKCKRYYCLALAVLAVSVMLQPLTLTASADSGNALTDYVQTIYDQTNGLPSASMDLVAAAPDGSIWVGGDAGLCRSDGTKFTYITQGHIANATALVSDSQGRLWIGTEDRGVAVWENGQCQFITQADGLASDSVCSVFESIGGDIYVGTSDDLCLIAQDLRSVKSLGCGVIGAKSIAQCRNGILACIDKAGDLVLLREGIVTGRWQCEDMNGRYTSVLSDKDDFLMGTSNGHLFRASVLMSTISSFKKIPVGDLDSINRLKYDSRRNLWICASNGIGFITQQDNFYMLRYPNFEKEIQDVAEDYQGNYWLASSEHGLMRLNRSPFADIYAYLEMDPQAVNSTAIYDEKLYGGTDHGLQAVDQRGVLIETRLSRAIGNQKVSCLMSDRNDRLWACTAENGLYCWDGTHAPLHYTQEHSGSAGNCFRCLMELPDGTIAAGSTDGITFIKHNKVMGTVTAQNGLQNTEILCMAPGPNGEVYAGSNGSGIYVIRDGKLTDHLGVKNGLSSEKILRIVPYADNYFVVASNSLNFLKNRSGRMITKFPYFNNYDMVLYNDRAWILSSCGIFITTPEELISQDSSSLHYQLYNYRNGFRGSLIAGAWSAQDSLGRMYLCTDVGVQRIDMNRIAPLRASYKMAFDEILADGNRLVPRNNVYQISADVDSLVVSASVFNYDPKDLRLRLFLDGFDKDQPILYQSSLAPVTYRNIPQGHYTLRLQILDNEMHVMQELSAPLHKEARMWETRYFRLYLFSVCTWMVIFATWVIMSIRQTTQKKRELEIMRRQLESQLKMQTHRILEQAQQLTDMQQHTIEGMATLIESRDGSTGDHVRNTAVYAKMIAREMQLRHMYPHEIDNNFVDIMGRIAPLHDVGKIKVSDLILNKPGKLTEEEYNTMKTHAAVGGEIIGKLLSEDLDPQTLQMAKDIATCHHERWDGTGYPAGLKGTEIPLCARIMAVADVFDALNSKRAYKQAIDLQLALDEMKANAGTQFQKEIVDVFIDLKPQIQKYLQERHNS